MRFIFNLIGAIIKSTGRLVAVMLGLVFMIAGGALTITVVGAIIGIPFAIFGFLLMLKGIF